MSIHADCKIIAVAIQKGGVGKTTVTRHVAHCLSAAGQRVLMIDLDPQSSLTAICSAVAGPDLADVLGDTQPGKLGLADVIRAVGPGLDIAPASIRLAQTESGLVLRRAREYVLRRALEPVVGNYDYILIDCPPALGMLLSNALIASQWVIVPVLLDAMSLHSIGLFLDSLSAMQGDYPTVARLLGTVIARSTGRTTLAREMLAEMTSRPELRLFQTIIPATVRVEEAALMSQPIHEYDPTSPAALAYGELTKEVIDRGKEIIR